MKKEKEKLLSLTTKDFKWEYFKASGKGGQNKNKRDTAVRVTHPSSGVLLVILVMNEAKEKTKKKHLNEWQKVKNFKDGLS